MAKLFRVKAQLNKRQIKEAVRQAKIQPLVKAAVIVERRAKEKLKGAGSIVTRDSKGRFVKGRSAPGEPPVSRTGNLRSSISHVVTWKNTVIIGPSVAAFYGQVHEFGAVIPVTPKMRAFLRTKGIYLRQSQTAIHIPARPFMRPALWESIAQFPHLFKGIPLSKTVVGRTLPLSPGARILK